MSMVDRAAPKEIDRDLVLGELDKRWQDTAGFSGGDLPQIDWVLDQLADLKVLRFGDLGSRDGELRREDHDDGHSIWLRTQNRDGRRGWFCVYSTVIGNVGGRLEDHEVAGLPTVRPLPGTPAAEAELAAIEHTDEFEPEGRDDTPAATATRHFTNQHRTRFRVLPDGTSEVLVGATWCASNRSLSDLLGDPYVTEVSDAEVMSW